MIGKKAPFFKAPAVLNGKDLVNDFSLDRFIGQKEVILFFYPKDFTFVCPTELIAFQETLNEFTIRNVALVGCSTDTAETHLAWLRTPRAEGGIIGITYPLVADVAKTIATNYGVLGGSWSYNEDKQLEFVGLPVAYRATFLIDKAGIIRHYSLNELALGRNINELLRIVDMWQHVQQHGEVCPVNWKRGSVAMQPSYEGVVSYFKKLDDN